MPELNFTPEGATLQATVPTEELIRSDAFLDEIMGNLSKTGQEPLQRLESSNRQEAVNNQNREVQAAEEQVEAQPAAEQTVSDQQQAQENDTDRQRRNHCRGMAAQAAFDRSALEGGRREVGRSSAR